MHQYQALLLIGSSGSGYGEFRIFVKNAKGISRGGNSIVWSFLKLMLYISAYFDKTSSGAWIFTNTISDTKIIKFQWKLLVITNTFEEIYLILGPQFLILNRLLLSFQEMS